MCQIAILNIATSGAICGINIDCAFSVVSFVFQVWHCGATVCKVCLANGLKLVNISPKFLLDKHVFVNKKLTFCSYYIASLFQTHFSDASFVLK